MVLVLSFGFLLGFLFRPHYDEYKAAKLRKKNKDKDVNQDNNRIR